jgi:hypothetical protein
MESQRDAKLKMLNLDTSSIAVELEGGNLSTTLNPNHNSTLASKASLTIHKKSSTLHNQSKLDSIKQNGSYLSKLALYEEEDNFKMLFLSPQKLNNNNLH